jgi:RNA polymerase sigma-70 factor (ECF subfamily)
MRVLRNRADAQDALQDVFLYIHRRRSAFDPSKGTVFSWVFQVTLSKAMNCRERAVPVALADCPVIDDLTNLMDRETHPEKLTDELSARKLVHGALAGLPELQREALRLYFFEGYSLREISAKRNESLGNTRHHYYRGIANLRRIVIREKGQAARQGA